MMIHQHVVKSSTVALIMGALLIGLLAGCNNAGSNIITGSGNMTTEKREVSGFSAVELTTIGTLTIQQGDIEGLTISAEDNLLPLLTSDVNSGKLVIGTKPNTSINPTKPVQYTLSVKTLTSLAVSGSGDVVAQSLTGDALSFTVSGSGKMTLGAVKAASLTFSGSGSGDAQLGTVKVDALADLHLTGSGKLTADSLDSADLKLTIEGSGDTNVSSVTTHTITARLSGSGSAALMGSTDSQQINVSGSGKYNADSLDSKTVTASTAGNGDITVKVSETLDATVNGSGSIFYTGSPQVTQKDNGSGEVKQR